MGVIMRRAVGGCQSRRPAVSERIVFCYIGLEYVFILLKPLSYPSYGVYLVVYIA